VKLFSGLNGATIEPLVPLLTFIGSIDFDKPIENKMVTNNTISSQQIEITPIKSKKKRGFHL